MNPVEADVLVAQMKINGLYLGGGLKAVVVNQVRFAEGDTKAVPVDGEPVTLQCTAIEGRSAKFSMGDFAFTLTSK